MMSSETVVDSKLWIHQSLDSALMANSHFQADPSNRAHLACQLLIYDRIAVPTTDFSIAAMIWQWLGDRYFREALENNAFYFLHKPSLLGYTGNGHALGAFIIESSSNSGSIPLPWWQEAIFADRAKALDLQLKNFCPSLNKGDREGLTSTILEHTQEIDYSEPIFTDHIANETYKDILNSVGLSEQIKLLSNKLPPIDLKRLPGVGDNQVRVSHSEPIKDSIDLVLKIAELNLLIIAATQAGNCDLYLPQGANRLLKEKLERCQVETQVLRQFISLLDLTNIPDLELAIESGDISLSEIWKLRQRRTSRKFREWFRSASTRDVRDLERVYVESLGQARIISSLPVKVLRFALTTGAGILNPFAGIAIGIVDSLFVDQWLRGFTPKVFLDQLANLYPIDEKK